MPMTLGEFRTQVRFVTRDHATAPVFATDTAVDFAVNKAVEQLNGITRSVNTSNISAPILTVVGTRLYAIPSGQQDIYELQYNGGPLPFRQLSEMPEFYGQGWYAITGEPECWYIEDEQVGLYPRASSAGKPIVLFSVKRPTPMTAVGHTTGMDYRLDMAVLYWAAEFIMISRREFDCAAEHRGKWKEALEIYQSVQINKRVRGGRTFLNYGWTP